MGTLQKSCQVVLAGAGFLVGHLWAALRWAERAGIPGGSLAAGSLLSNALLLAGAYSLLLSLLFWPLLPAASARGLRMVVAPTAFALSALLSALGLEAALRLVG